MAPHARSGKTYFALNAKSQRQDFQQGGNDKVAWDKNMIRKLSHVFYSTERGIMLKKWSAIPE